MEKLNIKEEARKLIDKLPANSTWDDLMYEIYVRQVVEAGLINKDFIYHPHAQLDKNQDS